MPQIRGAFPFPVAQIAEFGGKIVLPGGGIIYPPSGEYLVSLGTNTVIEMFLPIEQVWQSIASASDYMPFDGYNTRLHNITGCVTALTITGAGSGGTNGIGATATGATVAIAAGGGSILATAQPIVGGSVQAPTIAQAGSGFVVPPLIVIDPPPLGGVQALAYATISAGGIASIVMSNVGGGYQAPPNFWIIPQTQYYQGGPQTSQLAGVLPVGGLVYPGNAAPGNQNTSPTGAQLVPLALTGSGTLTGLHLTYPGLGMTSTPAVTISGVGAATATATVGNTTPTIDTSWLQPRVQ